MENAIKILRLKAPKATPSSSFPESLGSCYVLYYANSSQTSEFQALAQTISNGFPPGFDPYESGSDLLISLWETVPNYRYDYNIENNPFSSYNDKFAPHKYSGDNFTNIIRWNLNDNLTTSELRDVFIGTR